MKTLVEALEGNKVKLSIEVDEQEFEVALDRTFRKIAQEVRVPGFRPGKAPRRILEARLGKGVARQEAIRGSLSEYYAQAVEEHAVDVIAAPQFDIKAGEETGPLTFEAVVEVRPQVKLAGYGGLRITIPNPEVTEQDIADQVDRLRNNFGELIPVTRPAIDGDHLTIDLKASRGGDEKDIETDDLLYELGTGTVVAELDDHLRGAVAGDVFRFSAQLVPGGDTGDFEVVVKEVKEKVLPEVTDEWAGEASEFETVAELRADIEKRLSVMKRGRALAAVRSQAIEAVGELVTDEAPSALVDDEITRRAHELENALKQQGASIGQYLTASGRSQQDLIDELRAQSISAVKADLALRAVVEAEGIEASDEDVDAELDRLAERFEVKPEQVREQLESSGQMPEVRSDVRKGKAVEWLVDHLEAVDDEGHHIDLAFLAEGPELDTPKSETPEPGTPEAGEA